MCFYFNMSIRHVNNYMYNIICITNVRHSTLQLQKICMQNTTRMSVNKCKCYTDLRVENGNVDIIVTDQRSQPVPHVRHLQQNGLYHMIVWYQFLSSGPVYDVRSPSQWDPIICHCSLRFHRFKYLLLAIHHQTCVRHISKNAFHHRYPFFFFVFIGCHDNHSYDFFEGAI